MATTTDSRRPGATAFGVNNNTQKTTYTDTKPSTKPQGQAEVAGATVQHAENHDDDAPPGVPEPDPSSARDTLRKQAKPVFNRGPSMLDFTAVTSAGPTPAAEAAHSGSYFDGSRLRESHLPDEDEEQQQQNHHHPEAGTMSRRGRRQTVTEADSELPRHT